MSVTPPTIDACLREARLQLEKVGESAQLEGEILLAHALHCQRTTLRTWPEKTLSEEQLKHFQQLLARRIAGEPVAYIIGRREFWDMTLLVTPDTLIPRPETERLVEIALEKIPADAQWHIADLGTGSGAIALAIARERPHCQVIATDASAAALAIAKQNAQQLRVNNIRFFEGPWFEPLDGQHFELIVSNPPYVHPEDPHLSQGDLRFEPSQALQSMPDGLTDIRQIAEGARQYLTPPGWLILEHGFDQGSAVQQLFTTLGYEQVSIVEDLAQNERICLGQWDKASK